MKGALFIGLLGFALLGPIVAQQTVSATEGMASWYDTEDPGLFVSHSSYPFGTKLIITNKNNNKQITVQVGGRIPQDRRWVLDVSFPAANALEMEYEGFTPVKIEEVPREVRPRALRTNFRKITQVGQATGQFTGPGLTAAHPSISNGTKVKIVNQSNGREVVVTVIYRIRASQNRIIDLSQNAAQSLGILRGSSEVKIETLE